MSSTSWFPLAVEVAARSNPVAGIIGVVVGVLVVIGLITAFAVGHRRKADEPPPPPPGQPGQDSWSTPEQRADEEQRGER